jgi:hypothetical protein
MERINLKAELLTSDIETLTVKVVEPVAETMKEGA